MLYGFNRESYKKEKVELQLHLAAPGQKTKVQSLWTPDISSTRAFNGKRIPRQSENSALNNLRAIAAGKGSTLRVRSRARGRGIKPARGNIGSKNILQSSTAEKHQNKITENINKSIPNGEKVM